MIRTGKSKVERVGNQFKGFGSEYGLRTSNQREKWSQKLLLFGARVAGVGAETRSHLNV